MTIALCQDVSGYDSTKATVDTSDTVQSQPTRPHRIELGLNTMGIGLEYRYQVCSFLSSDAVLSVSHPGVGAGITLNPISFVFFQGVFGKPWFKEEAAADGPPGFSPDYAYAWRAGIHFPIGPGASRIYVVFSGGRLTMVQRKYQYNGGGFIVGPPQSPAYRTESRREEVFAVSLGFKI
ncbi:MAG: hypothetical protein WBD36_06140 [Bacteroidota bacterium]